MKRLFLIKAGTDLLPFASRTHQKDFGKGLHYFHSVVNGKEVLTQLKGFDDVSIQGSK